MRYELSIPPSEVAVMVEGVVGALAVVKQEVQGAMADAFYLAVMQNFGTFGTDRPWDWAPLSKAYARKVGRSYATLKVSGAMKAAVKNDNSDPDAATVSLSKGDIVYGPRHHFGDDKMPARRVFPIDLAGHVTAQTYGEVVEAARLMLSGVTS